MKIFTLLCLLVALFAGRQFGATIYDLMALVVGTFGILMVIVHRPLERLFFQLRLARDMFGRRQSDHRGETESYDSALDRRMRADN